jgi:hypothetical protein
MELEELIVKDENKVSERIVESIIVDVCFEAIDSDEDFSSMQGRTGCNLCDAQYLKAF